MGQDFYYTVNVKHVHRFEDESTARAFAASLADVLDNGDALFNLDMYYIDIDHTTWLTGYSNLPEE